MSAFSAFRTSGVLCAFSPFVSSVCRSVSLPLLVCAFSLSSLSPLFLSRFPPLFPLSCFLFCLFSFPRLLLGLLSSLVPLSSFVLLPVLLSPLLSLFLSFSCLPGSVLVLSLVLPTPALWFLFYLVSHGMRKLQ